MKALTKKEAKKLTGGNITVPDGYTGIGARAFYKRGDIINVEIPDSVTSIGDGAFSGCCSLAGIKMPGGLTSIGGGAFYLCAGLTSIEIPANVDNIGNMAFFGCGGLTAVNVDESNLRYSSENGVLFDKGKKTLLYYPSGIKNDSYTVPGGVTHIACMAFHNCGSLANIEIPSGVTSIGSGTFYGCEGLTVRSPFNSRAYKYCKKNNLPVLE